MHSMSDFLFFALLSAGVFGSLLFGVILPMGVTLVCVHMCGVRVSYSGLL